MATTFASAPRSFGGSGFSSGGGFQRVFTAFDQQHHALRCIPPIGSVR
jgi:hypothetical protein